MDVNKLVEVLDSTLVPEQREQAEQQLNEIHKIIGFAPTLLQVVMSDQLMNRVRQAGVIYLKNMICQFWDEKEASQPSDPVPFNIHEQDKQSIRDNIVEAVIAAPDPIRVQLSVCVSQMVKHDYPGKWPGIAEKVAIYIQSEQHDTWLGALRCLYELVKNFEYKKPDERGTLNQAMQHLLPMIHQRCAQLLPDQSEASVVLQKQILKIFFALIQYFLPLDLITKEMFTQWMELVREIVDRPVPEATNQIDEEERPELVWWKCKKWAVHILSRCFERYGSPGNVQKEYKQFSEWYLKNFSAGILQVLMKLLDQYRNKVYVTPRVLQLALNYLDQGISPSLSWKYIKPHMQAIVQNVIFPLMCHSEEDEELWEADPVEYIRTKYDVFEEYFSPVTAAQGLLHSAVSKRKEVLQKTMGLIMQVLTTPDLKPKQKAGALHMVGAVADILLTKKIYKDQVEAMLVNHVFPEFQSEYGYLRARACWMLHQFTEVKFKQPANLARALELTRHALIADKELPVKVEAAIALQLLLTDQECAKDLVRPHIREIILELLKIIRETEIDDLATVMQKLVCTYAKEITPLAVDITTQLAQTFAKVLESDTDGTDEKAIAAMGILNTLETICTVMEDQKEILQHIEGIVLDVVGLIMQQNVIEFYEEMLSLVYSITCQQVTERLWRAYQLIYQLFKNDNVDYFTEFYDDMLSLICSLTCAYVNQKMWQVLDVLYQMFKKDAFDYFTDMMPALHNYITVDPVAFLANPKHMEMMYDMCKTVLTSGDAGEDAECHAAKLLEVILLQFKGQVDQVVTSFVELALERLTREVRTSELRTMCLQVIIAALYYNPPMLLEILNKMHLPNSTESITGQFLKQWLHDTDCFLGLHDRKVCVLGLCCLLNTPSTRPQAVNDVAQQIIPSIILLFSGLARAYQHRAGEDDSDEEGEEEEEYVEGELEDDDDEIDEDGQVYIEKLEKSVNGEDSDDEEDYEGAEETALESYETPLDKEECCEDEYQIFKALLEHLQRTDAAWYQTLTGHLNERQRKDLEEVFTLAEQRRAAAESKEIEEKGGYVFTSMTVPSNFDFSSP